MKYLLAKKLYSTALSGFYSSVTQSGLHAIPDNQPVLFISNHNNAFIDPLLLASQFNRRVTFTAKNTLAKNPLLKLILKSFSVELLSRRIDRNGNDSGRAANAQALARLEQKLHNKGAIYIFPEGKSHNDVVLHEFKTGAAKIALSYEQNCVSHTIDNDLLIVPLALDYSDKSSFRSTASVQVGEPLSLRAWKEAHPEGDARTLTQTFQSMVVNVIATRKSQTRKAALLVQKPVLKSSLGARYRRWEKRILGTPFGGIGWMLNAAPFAITAVLMSMLSSDHDHPASAAIVVGPPVFAVAHALQLLSLGLLGSGFLMVLYLLMLVPSSLVGLKLIDRLKLRDERTSALPQV